jgi:hypothetical protein
MGVFVIIFRFFNMRKTDKKIDNQLRIALTKVCETALKEFTGFQWLTHLVNYANFPKTLRIVCVFDTNENLSAFKADNSNNALCKLIQEKLNEIGINLKNIGSHIAYDTQEECEKIHHGNWANRLGE